MNKIVGLLVLVLVMVGCAEGDQSSSVENPGNVPLREWTEGKSIYKSNCQSCHQKDGQGMGKLNPPLAKSDYLVKNRDKFACIVTKGLNKRIVVNGTTFHNTMPGNAALTRQEISDLATYVYNAFGNQEGKISVKEVTESLKTCN